MRARRARFAHSGAVEVGVAWCSVTDGLVGSDGVVDLAEALDFDGERASVVDRAAEQVMLLLMSSELGQLSSAVGLVVRGDEETEDGLA